MQTAAGWSQIKLSSSDNKCISYILYYLIYCFKDEQTLCVQTELDREALSSGRKSAIQLQVYIMF